MQMRISTGSETLICAVHIFDIARNVKLLISYSLAAHVIRQLRIADLNDR